MAHVYGRGKVRRNGDRERAGGERAQAQVVVTALGPALTLGAATLAAYGTRGRSRGSIAPALTGARVQIYRGRPYVPRRGWARMAASARGCCSAPGPYRASYGGARSATGDLVRPARRSAPLLATAVVGSRSRRAHGSSPPRAASSRPRLPRGHRVLAAAEPVQASERHARRPAGGARLRSRARGYAAVRKGHPPQVVLPSLAAGSRGPGVLALERRLVAAPVRAASASTATTAPTRWRRCSRSRRCTACRGPAASSRGSWRRLARAGVPAPRRGGDDLEVDKTPPGALRRGRRRVNEGRPRLDRRHRQHAARHLAGLPQGRRLGLGALVPDVLPARVRHPRLSVGARLSRLARLRAGADVDRAVPLRDTTTARRWSSTD